MEEQRLTKAALIRWLITAALLSPLTNGQPSQLPMVGQLPDSNSNDSCLIDFTADPYSQFTYEPASSRLYVGRRPSSSATEAYTLGLLGRDKLSVGQTVSVQREPAGLKPLVYADNWPDVRMTVPEGSTDQLFSPVIVARSFQNHNIRFALVSHFGQNLNDRFQMTTYSCDNSSQLCAVAISSNLSSTTRCTHGGCPVHYFSLTATESTTQLSSSVNVEVHVIPLNKYRPVFLSEEILLTHVVNSSQLMDQGRPARICVFDGDLPSSDVQLEAVNMSGIRLVSVEPPPANGPVGLADENTFNGYDRDRLYCWRPEVDSVSFNRLGNEPVRLVARNDPFEATAELKVLTVKSSVDVYPIEQVIRMDLKSPPKLLYQISGYVLGMAGRRLRFQLESIWPASGSNYFSLSPSGGVSLERPIQFDRYEKEYQLKFLFGDDTGGPVNRRGQIRIQVNGFNRNNPFIVNCNEYNNLLFDERDDAFYNKDNGQPFDTIQAVDDDIGLEGKLKYRWFVDNIDGERTEGMEPKQLTEYFSIDEDTGKIGRVKPFDFLALRSSSYWFLPYYIFAVIVSDSGNHPLTDVCKFRVEIRPRQRPAEFLRDAPPTVCREYFCRPYPSVRRQRPSDADQAPLFQVLARNPTTLDPIRAYKLLPITERQEPSQSVQTGAVIGDGSRQVFIPDDYFTVTDMGWIVQKKDFDQTGEFEFRVEVADRSICPTPLSSSCYVVVRFEVLADGEGNPHPRFFQPPRNLTTPDRSQKDHTVGSFRTVPPASTADLSSTVMDVGDYRRLLMRAFRLDDVINLRVYVDEIRYEEFPAFYVNVSLLSTSGGRNRQSKGLFYINVQDANTHRPRYYNGPETGGQVWADGRTPPQALAGTPVRIGDMVKPIRFFDKDASELFRMINLTARPLRSDRFQFTPGPFPSGNGELRMVKTVECTSKSCPVYPDLMRITVRDGHHEDTTDFGVVVKAANQFSPQFQSEIFQGEISLNAPAGSYVRDIGKPNENVTISVINHDYGTVLEYSIEMSSSAVPANSGQFGRDGRGIFAVELRSPAVRLLQPLTAFPVVKDTKFYVRLQVFDGNHTDTAVLAISVYADVPLFTQDHYTFTASGSDTQEFPVPLQVPAASSDLRCQIFGPFQDDATVFSYSGSQLKVKRELARKRGDNGLEVYPLNIVCSVKFATNPRRFAGSTHVSIRTTKTGVAYLQPQPLTGRLYMSNNSLDVGRLSLRDSMDASGSTPTLRIADVAGVPLSSVEIVDGILRSVGNLPASVARQVFVEVVAVSDGAVRTVVKIDVFKDNRSPPSCVKVSQRNGLTVFDVTASADSLPLLTAALTDEDEHNVNRWSFALKAPTESVASFDVLRATSRTLSSLVRLESNAVVAIRLARPLESNLLNQRFEIGFTVGDGQSSSNCPDAFQVCVQQSRLSRLPRFTAVSNASSNNGRYVATLKIANLGLDPNKSPVIFIDPSSDPGQNFDLEVTAKTDNEHEVNVWQVRPIVEPGRRVVSRSLDVVAVDHRHLPVYRTSAEVMVTVTTAGSDDSTAPVCPSMDKWTSFCQSHPDGNGDCSGKGKCLESGVCQCIDGLTVDGPQCQQTKRSFGKESFAQYKLSGRESCTQGVTSFSFVTSSTDDQLLLYMGPSKQTRSNQMTFIAIELLAKGRQLKLTVHRLNQQKTDTLTAVQPLSDGLWHTISLSREGSLFTMTLDECRTGSSVLSLQAAAQVTNCPTGAGRPAQFLSTSQCRLYLGLPQPLGGDRGSWLKFAEGDLIQLGGKNDTSFPTELKSTSLKGCISNLRHDSILYDLGSPVHEANSQPGCRAELEVCGYYSSSGLKCRNNASCSLTDQLNGDGSVGYRCRCLPGFTGANCDKQALSLATGDSGVLEFAGGAAGQRRQRRQTADSQALSIEFGFRPESTDDMSSAVLLAMKSADLTQYVQFNVHNSLLSMHVSLEPNRPETVVMIDRPLAGQLWYQVWGRVEADSVSLSIVNLGLEQWKALPTIRQPGGSYFQMASGIRLVVGSLPTCGAPRFAALAFEDSCILAPRINGKSVGVDYTPTNGVTASQCPAAVFAGGCASISCTNGQVCLSALNTGRCVCMTDGGCSGTGGVRSGDGGLSPLLIAILVVVCVVVFLIVILLLAYSCHRRRERDKLLSRGRDMYDQALFENQMAYDEDQGAGEEDTQTYDMRRLRQLPDYHLPDGQVMAGPPNGALPNGAPPNGTLAQNGGPVRLAEPPVEPTMLTVVGQQQAVMPPVADSSQPGQFVAMPHEVGESPFKSPDDFERFLNEKVYEADEPGHLAAKDELTNFADETGSIASSLTLSSVCSGSSDGDIDFEPLRQWGRQEFQYIADLYAQGQDLD